MHHQRILVLGTLDEEHHEERDADGAGVDDERPVFGVVEQETHRGPYQYNEHGDAKDASGAGQGRRAAGQTGEEAGLGGSSFCEEVWAIGGGGQEKKTDGTCT